MCRGREHLDARTYSGSPGERPSGEDPILATTPTLVSLPAVATSRFIARDRRYYEELSLHHKTKFYFSFVNGSFFRRLSDFENCLSTPLANRAMGIGFQEVFLFLNF